MAARAERADGPEDVALLRRYGAGDRRAAAELTRRLAPRLFAFSTRMLGDAAEAEDVTQETMLRLWKAAPTWRPDGARPSTWAFRVAANLCTDRLRRRGRTAPLAAAGDPPDDGPAAADDLQDAVRAARLEAALGELPERQRQAVALRHLEELSNPEVADAMGLSVPAVESLLARGRRALAALLAPQRDALGYRDDRG